jgi:transcriptional regulator
VSRGPVLTDQEIERAAELRAKGLTWRVIAERLQRDHAGLCRAVRKYESAGQ